MYEDEVEAAEGLFRVDARAHLEVVAAGAVGESPGAHDRDAHARGLLEDARYNVPGLRVRGVAHEIVEVDAVHEDGLPVQYELCAPRGHEPLRHVVRHRQDLLIPVTQSA